MTLWVALLAAIGLGAVVPLLLLNRQRRLFLLDPRRRRFFLRYIQRAASPPALPLRNAARNAAPATVETPNVTPPAAPANGASATGAAPDAPQAASHPADAVVYVDAKGQCTFANQAARELLHWRTGDLALRDVLAGGSGESDALLESLARRGLVEQHPSTLAGPTRAPLEINAVAVRDRDDNLWGAALFIRRASGAPAAALTRRQALSRH